MENAVTAPAFTPGPWRTDWLGDAVFYQEPFYQYFLAVLYRIFGRSYGVVYFVPGRVDHDGLFHYPNG